AFIRSGGVDTYVRDLPPGVAATLSFSPGQAALFRNPGPAQARLKLLVWGDTDVGMRYEPNTPGR
ncbi:MAG: hypothetical protein K2Q20_08645, partial [Phycisphaerales bacterium]|nr:hypothetical protein [Phycisphaerales bacterium]